MLLPDVNVLVYAFRRESRDHESFRSWLEHAVNDEVALGMSELVLSGFIRVVTSPRVFRTPTHPAEAVDYARRLIGAPACRPLRPGPRHLDIFLRLCEDVTASGNAVPDAYHAALAIESGSEWVTCDRGFARFPGLRWRHPLAT
jgi:toxin-antitoxin system PIN domain toxin